jgi:hypothetical protein
MECKHIVDELILKVVPEKKMIGQRYNLLQSLFKTFQYRIG